MTFEFGCRAGGVRPEYKKRSLLKGQECWRVEMSGAMVERQERRLTGVN